MCFSARISFFTVGLLVSIAIATYRKIRTFNEIPLASIPTIFAIQQLAEGLLWLLLPETTYPGIIALLKYTFLSVALIVWPIFIPFSLLLLEKEPMRRAIMAICLVLGFVWALGSLWYLVHYGALVDIRQCHIYYEVAGIDFGVIRLLLTYCTITILPFLASSSYSLRLLGALIGISCAISYVAWYSYFTSVWCFFAALLSLGVYKIISERRHIQSD